MAVAMWRFRSTLAGRWGTAKDVAGEARSGVSFATLAASREWASSAATKRVRRAVGAHMLCRSERWSDGCTEEAGESVERVVRGRGDHELLSVVAAGLGWG